MEEKDYEYCFNFHFDLFESLDSFDIDETYKITVPRFFADSFFQEGENLKLKNTLHIDDIFFSFKLNNFVDSHENIILICVKDKVNLLDFTLSKICSAAKKSKCDILVIDDRPVDDSILNIAKKYSVSCLRVSNSADIFNYSMLNNVAVAVSQKFGKKTCIFWNCDMWAPDEDTLERLISKHRQYGANLSGTRLIYPCREDYRKVLEDISPQDKSVVDHFGTIQHGGIYFKTSEWFDNDKKLLNSLETAHQWRFFDANYFLASRDMPMIAVTGAFWIISIADFMDVGGFNPCLPSIHQDIDFCLKLNELNKFVYYIGTEYLLHAENFFFRKLETPVPIKVSDKLIYDHIWSKKINLILGLKPPQKNVKTINLFKKD